MQLLASLAILFFLSADGAELDVINQWTTLNFDLPYDFPSGMYIPENNLFTGLEVSYDRVFLALPRLRRGVAASVAWIPRSDLDGHIGSSPTLQPYPNWEWHRPEANCSGLISVYRVRADRCDRLWILDAGILNSLETYTPVCPPKLLSFDIKTDRLLTAYEFPREALRLNSLLTNMVFDYEGVGCDDMLMYISDTASPGILVHDVSRQMTWRVSHTSMWPDPEKATYQVAGESFTLPDGIVGLALSPPPPVYHGFYQPLQGSSQLLYFQPLASEKIFSVPTSALKTPPNPDDRENSLPVKLIGYKSSQSAALALDPKDGYLYFSPLTETAIAAWEPVSNKNRLVAYDPQLLQFASDIRVADRDNGNMWLLSNRLQKLFRRSYNPGDVNFRIMKIRSRSSPLPQHNNSLFYY